MTGRDVTRVRTSPIHGRGVFAGEPVAARRVLERGHVLVLSPGEPMGEDSLNLYVFGFGRRLSCLLLGSSTLCNHSTNPNAEIEIDANERTYRLVALRRIERNEEILIDYGQEYWEA